MVHFQREEGRGVGGGSTCYEFLHPLCEVLSTGAYSRFFLQTFIVNKWLQIYENHIYIYICELRLKRGMWIVS